MQEKSESISKFLSFILRHKPESIGLRLDAGGWASVEELVLCAMKAGHSLSPEIIRDIVESSDKQRFRLSEDGARIRANQGHSFEVDLGLEPRIAPGLLFHGTATRFLDAIMAEGLLPRGRQHVHLSADRITALSVGRRHGTPVVLAVDASAMQAAGHQFVFSDNGVWLVDHVPARYLRLAERSEVPT